MKVNEGDNHVYAFISGSDDDFTDHLALFNDGTSLPDIMQPNDLEEYEILVDQQPTKISLFIPKGITVCWHNSNQVKLCEMISNENKNGIDTQKMKFLGSNDIITLPQSSVELVCTPDPSTIPEDITDIDDEALHDKLPHDGLKSI